MGRIDAQADLRDDLSPKIAQTAQNVDSAVGKMKGDFADLERSTTASFGEMVGSFAGGQIAADLFRGALRQVAEFVNSTADAYLDHNKAVREAGGAYDHVIDRMDEAERHMAENDIKIGEHTSKWKEFWLAVRGGASDVAVAFSDGMPDDPDHARSVLKNRGETSVGDTISQPGNYRPGSPFLLPGYPGQSEAQQKNNAKVWKDMADENERGARAAEREAAAAERTRLAREKTEAALSKREYDWKSGLKARFMMDGPDDPTDPWNTNTMAHQSKGGADDGSYGAFNPISDQYMKALKASQDKAVDDAKKWGNLWSGTINSTLEAVLFDTHNFGKDFANIIKKALMQALVGDISMATGGPIGKILGGFLGIKDARTGFETQVAPEMARASARGKL